MQNIVNGYQLNTVDDNKCKTKEVIKHFASVWSYLSPYHPAIGKDLF